MHFSLSRTISILVKEFIQLNRDKVNLAMIAIVPIIQLFLFGYAINADPKHLPAAVLSQDNSTITRAFIAGLKNTEYFSIDYEISSDNEGHALLKNGSVFFVITIPIDFERNLVRGLRPQILIEADGTDPVAISGALGAINGMVDTILQAELKGSLAYLNTSPPPVEVRIHKHFNPESFTKYNIVPALIPIILIFTGISMSSLTMTKEREYGTLENLLAMPVLPIEVMIGKITPYVLIGFFQAALIVFFAKMLFDIPIIGSLTLLFFATTIFIICNMALGFAISTVSQNQMQALQISSMATLPSILLSGFLFPFLGMPFWAQIIGAIFPAKHFIAISRGILLKGSNFIETWPHLWPMIVFMIVITIIAMRSYRKTMD